MIVKYLRKGWHSIRIRVMANTCLGYKNGRGHVGNDHKCTLQELWHFHSFGCRSRFAETTNVLFNSFNKYNWTFSPWNAKGKNKYQTTLHALRIQSVMLMVFNYSILLSISICMLEIEICSLSLLNSFFSISTNVHSQQAVSHYRGWIHLEGNALI